MGSPYEETEGYRGSKPFLFRDEFGDFCDGGEERERGREGGEGEGEGEERARGRGGERERGRGGEGEEREERERGERGSEVGRKEGEAGVGKGRNEIYNRGMQRAVAIQRILLLYVAVHVHMYNSAFRRLGGPASLANKAAVMKATKGKTEAMTHEGKTKKSLKEGNFY